VNLHFVDATYELFRAHYAPRPGAFARDGREVGAVVGLLYSLLGLLRDEGATHVGCATDHVIRSFRNDLYAGYKTEAGVPPELLAQFPLAERAMEALGLVVWPMTEFEADDALATAASRWAERPGVHRVIICTPDKDLAQCVRGELVVTRDRRRDRTLDEAGVAARWGVAPASIPDYLALVGDAADGFPGLPGWGARSAAAVLGRFGHLEAIPTNVGEWGVDVRSPAALNATLRGQWADALLFRRLGDAGDRRAAPPARP
jgi:5'-3' exonuclease